MKRTVIKYKPCGEKVQIVGIENVASLDDISEEFGKDVAEIYSRMRPIYTKFGCRGVSIDFGAKFSWFEISSYIEKEEFSWLIRLMKAAGNNLEKAKKQAKEEVKEVII